MRSFFNSSKAAIFLLLALLAAFTMSITYSKYYNKMDLDPFSLNVTPPKFEYYSTLNLAVTDVNNGTIGENADVDKEDAVAGIYTDNGNTYVVLLKDSTEGTISPAVDMTINLGGNTLTSTATYAVSVTAGDVTIDGRLAGSTVEINGADGSSARTIRALGTSNVAINGGAYICNTTGSVISIAINVADEANLAISNATITATATAAQARAFNTGSDSKSSLSIVACEIYAASNSGKAYGVASFSKATTITDCNITAVSTSEQVVGVGTYTDNSNGEATISNCVIQATSNGAAIGVANDTAAETTISDCDIKAYANYNHEQGSYTAISQGILSKSTAALTLNNCYVMGTHSGAQSDGTLYVNGGTYEGYGHGGFYFSGADTTAYVSNAIIRQCDMPDGYSDLGAGCNNAGFYIGGGSGATNISVYMDSCEIYGAKQPIVLRGTAGEQNSTLYISNSTVTRDGAGQLVRIDNDTHKLYIGTGCNITADDASLPGVVTQTDEVYTKE